MIDRPKKLKAQFYETPMGRKPVRDWLLELEDKDRRSIGFDIQTVEFGWPVGMPTCKPLGNGLGGSAKQSERRKDWAGYILYEG